MTGVSFGVPTRGPVEPPTSSGRHAARARVLVQPRRRVVYCRSGSDEVQPVRTYVEDEDRVYAAGGPAPLEDEGSIAALIPGGLPSQRPDPKGAETLTARLEAARPLKINQDLKMYRGRRLRTSAQRLRAGTQRKEMELASEAAFKDVIKRDPSDVRAYVSLGTLYARGNRLADARRIFDEGCIVSQGCNPYVWTALANLERKAGNFKKARACYDAALVNRQEHAAAWHGWGMLEKEEGNFTAARDVFVRGIAATKDNPSSYLFDAMGNLAADLGFVDEARYWFRRGTNTPLGTLSHALYTSWGVLEWKQGDAVTAPYLFDMALRQHPKNRFALLSYAMFEKERGSTAKCVELLERALELNPTDPALFQAYAIVSAEDGHLDKARSLYQKGLDVNKRHQPLWQAYGIMEWKAGNVAKARDLFQRGVWADPKSRNNVYLFQAWAVMEGKVGNCAEARLLFKAGLKAQPNSEHCWQAWVDMEMANGLYESADQLRNYRAAALRRLDVPRNFSTLPSSSKSIIETIVAWANVFEKGPLKASSKSDPDPEAGEVESEAETPIPAAQDSPQSRPQTIVK